MLHSWNRDIFLLVFSFFYSVVIKTNKLFSYPWQWTLQAACMTTSFVCRSCILTVKYLFWLMNSRRNRISFVYNEHLVSFTSNWVFHSFEGCCWFDHDENVDYSDCNPPGPFISVIHTSSSFHPFTSSHTTFSPFPRTFSSVFCLNDTYWVFILAFHRLFSS